MSEYLVSIFSLLVLLQIKHLFADFFLQTTKMLVNRSTYAHMGRAQHAGIHAAGSGIAFVIVGAPVPFIIVTLIAEWIVHFHIDWGKAAYSKMKAYTPKMAGFWRAVGVDQALHHLTYVAMVVAWVIHALPQPG
ncbi:MAG: DUF3307 domain-containing protein [Rhodobacteraceae bacterium]|nr:DUF3307 domain-containing protein [Paracoccaceae bacterium]